MKLFHNKKFLITFFTVATLAIVIGAVVAIKIQLDKASANKAVAQMPEKKQEKIEALDIPEDDDSFLSLEDLESLEEEEEEPIEAEEVKVTTKNERNQTVTTTAKKSNGMPYFIRINNALNCVTVYTQDSDGNYTIPVKAMICSTGTATPASGTYKTSGKWRWATLFGGVYGQYATRIKGNILFHSVPYKKNYDPGSLEWWEYDKLGTRCSMGCIRLTVADALWIYNNIGSGTMVEFYSDSSSAGPLGKPGARKISSNELCHGWDPTDPDGNNPWRNQPSPTPSVEPTVKPTVTPSQTTTPEVTITPSVTPSVTPAETQNPTPTEIPSETPSTSPSEEPTPPPADVEEDVEE